MCEVQKISIAVCIVTYNHEKYIAQSIESALSQETDFQIHLFIGNDNSSDKTLEICQAYQKFHPEMITIIQHEENIGTVRNTFSIFREILKQNNKYRYTAMLDGDDYWCDDYKLQKQINFLENNPDYGLIHTGIAQLDDVSGRIWGKVRKNVKTGYIFPNSLEEPIANCTVVHRTELLQHVDMDEIEKANLLSCDYITNVIVSKWSNVGYLNEITAVWRRNINSVSSSQDMEKSFRYIDHEIRSGKYLSSFFPEVYPFSEAEQNTYIARRKMEIALKFKDYKLARYTYNSNEIFKKRKLLGLSVKNKLFFSFFLYLKQLNNLRIQNNGIR